MKSNTFKEKFFRFVINSPKLVILISLVLICLLSSGVTLLQIDNDFRVYLSDKNPQLQAFESFERDYIKSENITIVVTAKDGDVFSRQGLSLIENLTEQSWQISYTDRVSSLTNYQYSYSKNDDVRTDYLVDNAVEFSNTRINEIREIALKEKALVKQLITADGKLALIFINLNIPEGKPDTVSEVSQQVEDLLSEYRTSYPLFELQSGGTTTFNTTLGNAVAFDVSVLLPLSYMVIFAGLALFLRSVIGAVHIFILISVCLLSTFGFYGWFAPVLTPIAGFAPNILLSIIVADSVHILVTYFHQVNETETKREAIFESLNINFMPILITTVTTIIGFLCLNFSSSPPYQDLGNIVAFGVLIAFIFSLTIFPSLLVIMPIKKGKINSDSKMFGHLATFIIANGKKIFLTATMVVLILASFIPQSKLRDNWAHYFDDSFELVKLNNKIDGYLTGLNTIEYSLRPVEGRSIYDPDYLNQIDEFQFWYENQLKVVNVNSFSELIKDINQLMHNDEEYWYRIPESSELAAQYLLFYEMGLPNGLGLNNLIPIQRDASRFTVSIEDSGSDELLLLDQKAQNWIKTKTTAIQSTEGTGLSLVFAHIAQRNILSLLGGTLVALIGISIVLMLVFKSLKYGFISLIPNIIPAVMAYGLWSVTYGYVDISLSIVACATLGIVVDDTVHFLHKYILSRQKGLTTTDAIKDSFNRVGSALVTTTIVLVSGFMILAMSAMKTSATMGILMAITLIFALLVDFLLLPLLLLYFDKKE